MRPTDGWEGIIAKRRTSVYETRRSKEWLKIKAINEQELVIVGWQPSTATDRDIGSLHLAVFDDDGELRYAGKVGTGFSAKLRGYAARTTGEGRGPEVAGRRTRRASRRALGASRASSRRWRSPSGPPTTVCAIRRSSACATTRARRKW